MCATSSTNAHTRADGKGASIEGKQPAPPPRPRQRGLLCLSPFAILLLSAVLESAALALILPAYPGLCKELGIDLKMRGWMISVRARMRARTTGCALPAHLSSRL